MQKFFCMSTDIYYTYIINTIYIYIYVYIESPPKKTKKMIAAEAKKEQNRKMAIESDRWIQRSRLQQCNLMDKFGKCIIPVDWLSHPTEAMNARIRKQDRVLKIFDSIGENGVQSGKRIVGFVCKEDLLAAGMDPENPQFDVTMLEPPVPIYTIIGDHTVAAIQMWHAEKPNNSKYKTVSVELIVSSKDENNLNLIKHAGTLDNKIMAMSESNTMWENIEQMHRNFVRIEANYANAGQAVIEHHKKTYRKWAKSNFTQATATQCTMFTLANFRGEMWELIKTIFDGKCEPRKSARGKKKAFIAPTSANAFKQMSDIPEYMLMNWMKQVISGSMEVKDFGDMCGKYKKEKAVQNDIVNFINIQRPSHEFKTYDDAAGVYTFLADPDWFKMITGSCGKNLKEQLPTTVKTDIIAKIKCQEESSVCIYILFGVICELLIIDIFDCNLYNCIYNKYKKLIF